MAATRTSRTRKPTVTREERAAKITAIHELYKQYRGSIGTDEAAIHAARFDHYSERNAILIVAQRPDATVVRGFKAWQAEGRMVRKGEKGIAVLAPAGQTEIKDENAKDDNGNGKDDAERVRRFFRLTYVFDITQTDPVVAVSSATVAAELDRLEGEVFAVGRELVAA